MDGSQQFHDMTDRAVVEILSTEMGRTTCNGPAHTAKLIITKYIFVDKNDSVLIILY